MGCFPKVHSYHASGFQQSINIIINHYYILYTILYLYTYIYGRTLQ